MYSMAAGVDHYPCFMAFYWSTIDPYSSLKFQIFSYTCGNYMSTAISTGVDDLPC